MTTEQAALIQAELDHLEGLIKLEVGDRNWVLILESENQKGSAILSSSSTSTQTLIDILSATIVNLL